MDPQGHGGYGLTVGSARALWSPGAELQVTLPEEVTMKPWYIKDHFLPREIERDPFWQKLPESHKKTHRFLCYHSYLTSRSPTRRYCEWTNKQIAEHVGLSKRQVQRIIHRLRAGFLIYRHYDGDSGSTSLTGSPRPPRYEIPASRGMSNWWKRTRKYK